MFVDNGLLLFLDGSVTKDPRKVVSGMTNKCIDVVGLKWCWKGSLVADGDKF